VSSTRPGRRAVDLREDLVDALLQLVDGHGEVVVVHTAMKAARLQECEAGA
jgi:hypothetical protein